MEYALRDIKTTERQLNTLSLNPYSNGICSTSMKHFNYKIALNHVLILILMEYALRVYKL